MGQQSDWERNMIASFPTVSTTVKCHRELWPLVLVVYWDTWAAESLLVRAAASGQPVDFTGRRNLSHRSSGNVYYVYIWKASAEAKILHFVLFSDNADTSFGLAKVEVHLCYLALNMVRVYIDLTMTQKPDMSWYQTIEIHTPARN